MAANIPLQADQGATFRQVLNFTNPDLSAVVFTGCSGKMQVRPAFNSTVVTETLTDANGGLTFALGSVTMLLSATLTAAIPVIPSKTYPPSLVYYYDLLITFPSGDTNKYAYGTFTVVGTITH